MTTSKSLHIVSFDVPYPANYGGVIDIFYKLKSLHELGVDITLHCFQYGRKKSKMLESYCSKVHYYRRNNWKNPFLNSLPYIVCTRNSNDLLENLLLDEAPILFEGVHCTFFLRHPELKGRHKIVRMHNIEHDYYKNLEKVESNFFRKYFYKVESDKLKKYQKHLKHADAIAAISKSDTNYLKKWFDNTVQISAFHPNKEVTASEGLGKFAYYHGNLSVGENNHAALFLVNKVFNKLDFPLIIAGNNPSQELIKAVEKYPHIKLKSKLNSQQVMNLIAKAQINILPTFQKTGIKLKLLNALYMGRHCIVTPDMVEDTGLESLCEIGNSAKELRKLVERLNAEEYTEGQIKARMELLEGFGNKENAHRLIQLIYEHSTEVSVV